MTPEHYDIWQGEDGLRNIIPQRGTDFPEGFDVYKILQDIFPENEPIVEVGCGRGRLARAFSSDYYLGIDINKMAIDVAIQAFPEHTFVHSKTYSYPASAHKLAYTVMMHVPDNEIEIMIRSMCKTTIKSIVIAECLGRSRRREKEKKKEGWIQPTFGRDQGDYEDLFDLYDWRLAGVRQEQYATKGEFTFLTFEKMLCTKS